MAANLAALAVAHPALAASLATATMTGHAGSHLPHQAATSGASTLAGHWKSLTAGCLGSVILDDIEHEELIVADEGTEASTLRLRLCVFSGDNLPRERSYAVVVIGAGSELERRVTGIEAKESEHPLWRFNLDEEINMLGSAPKVDIRIFGKRMVGMGDKLLGAASIQLPMKAMEGPKKQELKLRPVPGLMSSFSCSTQSAGKVTVVWQLCRPEAYALDLSRVAEMDTQDLEAITHTVTVKLFKFALKQPSPQQKVQVTCKLIRLDGQTRPLARVSPHAMTWPETESASQRLTLNEDDLLLCKEATWAQGGLSLDPFVLHESKVMLMSWFLEISVHSQRTEPQSGQQTEGKGARKTARRTSLSAVTDNVRGMLAKATESQTSMTLVGSWMEPLSDLMQPIADGGHALHFNADLGIRTGHVNVVLDVYTAQPHRSLTSIKGEDAITNHTSIVPVRQGMPPENKWGDRFRYCCSFFADGLPVTRPLRPYIRITMGNSSTMSEVYEDGEVNDVVWSQPATLDTTRFHRKATVELYHCLDASGTKAPESDELLGTQTIYDVSLDREYWIHYYGGALNAPNQDIALNMVKGAIRPASTYQGSVCVVMGSKRHSNNEFTTRVLSRRQPRRLIVRLQRGLYMDRFKGQKVNVLVQLAGCRVPDAEEAQRLQVFSQALQKARETEDRDDLDRATALSRVHPDPLHLNPNVLMFSGEVDDVGVLRFLHERTPGQPPELCDWVELQTLKDYPLHVPPGPSHIYLYVVPKGKEKEPPQVFGRLRVTAKSPGQAGSQPPRWRRLRLDRSVGEDMPQSYFSNNLEGFILGSAHLTLGDEGSPQAGELRQLPKLDLGLSARLLPTSISRPWLCGTGGGPCGRPQPTMLNVGSMGEPTEAMRDLAGPKPTRTVYCYVDVLAARELPAMDEDGLMDPSYRVRILDKELTQSGGMHKTTSPTFMHRLVIPFEVEVQSGAVDSDHLVAASMPMPPVIVSILDYDQSNGMFQSEKFETVGSVVVKHAPASSRDGNVVYKMLDYDETKITYPKSGAEFMTAPSPLDLNDRHKAQWFSLDAPGRAVFDSAAGGVVDTWNKRPRILVAVGYSLQEVQDPQLFGKPIALCERSQGKAWHIECDKKACYQIDIDLLGLRNLPPSLLNPRLSISSFWDGPRVSFDVSSTRDHTFHQGNREPEVMNALAEKMKPLLTLYDPTTGNMKEEGVPSDDLVSFDELNGCRVRAPVYRVPVIPYLQKLSLKAGRWKMTAINEKAKTPALEFNFFYSASRGSLEGSLVTKGKQGLEEFTEIHEGRITGNSIEWRCLSRRWSGRIETGGGRILDLASALGGTGGATGSRVSGLGEEVGEIYIGEWTQDSKVDPFVLLPTITFELTNALTGVVYLTMTVGLNRLLLKAGGLQVQSWTALSLQEMAKLPKELKEWAHPNVGESESPRGNARISKRKSSPHEKVNGMIKPVSNAKTTEDAYMCFVDVFAADSGYLTFDTDLRIGRPLSEQCLFYIAKNHLDSVDSEPKVHDDAIPQYFNPGDWMCRGYEGPFDMRVTPSFHCNNFVHSLSSVREKIEDPNDGGIASFRSGIQAAVSFSSTSRMDTLRARISDALKRVNEILKPNVVEGSRHTKPLGPSQLFKSVLGHGGCVTKEQLQTMTTQGLKEKMAKHGWRVTSHLVAPEIEKVNPSALVDREHLAQNLHTFMRPVGHIIRNSDRDSRLLCRMQMGLPLHALEDLRDRLSKALQLEVMDDASKALLDEERRFKTAGTSTVNFLVIKFKFNGMVIWTAPEENAYFGRPGTPMFAVRLADHPDVVVPVFLPSFDIRRKAETVWYPVKTLRDQFSTLLQRIQHQTEGDTKRSAQKRWSRARSIRQQNKECPSGLSPEIDEDNMDEVEIAPDIVDNTEPDGYTRPIAVAKNAFICRIRRRMGGVAFDRAQTKNWFRTALEDAFPETKMLQADKNDSRAYKTYIMSRFMNLSKTMTVGMDRSGSAVLKGHINCKRVQDPEQTAIQDGVTLPLCTAPEQVTNNSPSIENLWISETVFVRVYIMSAHKLDVGSLGLAGNLAFKPYFSASLGVDVQHGKVIEFVSPGSQTVNFYQKFVFQSTFPGTALLNLELMHKGIMNDTVVGSLVIDIEDRLLALKRRSFREASNEDFLRKRIAPKQCLRGKKERDLTEGDVGWGEPIDPELDQMYGTWLKPHRAFSEPSPIECEKLSRLDEENAGEGRAGLLRYIIDFTPAGSYVPEDPEIYGQTEFQVRLTVYSVENIKVFRDFGERNDVYVKANFRSQDYDGNVQSVNHTTDTHKYARKMAGFNWNMSFNCRAPSTECSVEMTLMDADKFGDNDLIYYPKYYSLDHHLWLAYKEHREGRKPLNLLTDTIVFDRWPKVEEPMPTCSCAWWRRLKRKLKADKKMFATMKIGISIVPKCEADKEPFEDGQFSMPRDRFSYVTAMENPNATAKMLLGPTRWLKLRIFVGFWIVVIGLLILFMTIYFIMQVNGGSR